MPERIQRKRTKGWRMPEGAVYVGRGSKWGNPARIGRWVSVGEAWRHGERCTMSTVIRTREEAAMYYRLGLGDGGMVAADHLGKRLPAPLPSLVAIRTELAGKDLACWCPLDSPCHADVLLELANEEA